MNQGVGNVNLFIRIIKERLNDNFIQNWNSELKDFRVPEHMCYFVILDHNLI